ncbi:MAG TPA: energy transducer TonB [Methylobacter sp.]
MSNFISAKLFTAISLYAIALGVANAAETPAQLDPKAPCEKPEYPRASLVNEETGVVTMALLIAVDGHVLDSKIDKSSGFKNLDNAALRAFVKCKFKPIMKDGKAEQDWVKLQQAWKLD